MEAGGEGALVRVLLQVQTYEVSQHEGDQLQQVSQEEEEERLSLHQEHLQCGGGEQQSKPELKQLTFWRQNYCESETTQSSDINQK